LDSFSFITNKRRSMPHSTVSWKVCPMFVIRELDIVTSGNTGWSEDSSDCYGNLGSEEQNHLAMGEYAP
jgi:hypothetical protein